MRRWAHAHSARCKPHARSTGVEEDSASTHRWTLKPCSRRSSVVCCTHTCASMPTKTKSVTCLCSASRAATAGQSIVKVVFSNTSACETSSSSTVLPRPLGYCSVTRAGILSSMAALSIRCDPATTAGKLRIALLNRSCTSQTRKMHLSGVSRAILRAIPSVAPTCAVVCCTP